jgi:hypothetical protein
MSSSVRDLFDASETLYSGFVRWGQPVALNGPGLYVVALTDNPERRDAITSGAALSDDLLNTLLARRPELAVDGVRPDGWALKERVSSFWIPTETVLYIGKASTSVRVRVDQFYRTKLGARSPHAGGWFLKLTGHTLFVHYGPSLEPIQAEHSMLGSFVRGVSQANRGRLHDPERPMPFANLEWPKGLRKRHGITGATGDLGENRPVVGPLEAPPRDPTDPRRFLVSSEEPTDGRTTYRTQRITENDIAHGQIRVPRETREIFPPTDSEVVVHLRGERMVVPWRPRLGPDRERSGVLRFPSAVLRRSVSPGEVLAAYRTRDGVLLQ